MPKNVRCNVADHRLLDGKKKCEDVTKIGLPTLEHPTTNVKSAGMAMEIEMPDIHHFKAMEITVAHNNGTNCRYLSKPGVHNIEARAAVDNYVTKKGSMDLALVKVRTKCVHKSTEQGDIENGNPLGFTEHYSIIRYEEEFEGEIWNLVDATTGQFIWHGTDYSNQLSSLLD